MRRALGPCLAVIVMLLATGAAVYAEGPRLLTLPEAGRAIGAPLSSSNESVLKVDSGLTYGYRADWAADWQAAVKLEARPDEYPLTVHAVDAYLYCLPGGSYPSASSDVTLRAHVYAVSNGQPGALLGSSPPVAVDLETLGCQGWITLEFTTGVVLPQAQAFFAAIEYVSGQSEATPSLITDLSTDIPHGVCYYRPSSQPWTEHYGFAWDSAADAGYSMLRARVSGPYVWAETVATASADTFLIAEQPYLTGQGAFTYLLGGDYGGAWGRVRPMLRFDLPSAPVVGAEPVAAQIQLVNWRAISDTVAVDWTVRRVTEPWPEDAAGWYTYSVSIAESYGTSRTEARPHDSGYRTRLLQFDILSLVQAWRAGTYGNYGVAVLGGEGQAQSAKWFYAREASGTAETYRPRLLVTWRWSAPEPHPTASPTQTLQPMPTQASGMRRALVLPLILRPH